VAGVGVCLVVVGVMKGGKTKKASNF